MIKLKNIDISFKNWIRNQTAAFGMAGNSQTLFVNDAIGSDSYTGLDDPEKPKKSIGSAIAKANAWDVIYIAPKAWVSGNLWLGSAYQEASSDLAISYAKQGLALVGIGHQGLIGPAYGVVITEKTSSTAALLKVHAPMCAFENLTFYNASTAINGLYIYGDVAGTSEAALTSVYNCHFHGCLPAGATGDTGGAIYSHAAWGTTVDKCTFMGCRIGVSMKSDAGTNGKFICRNSEFFSRLTSASDISADVYVYTQGSVTISIHDLVCGHLIPSYSGGHGRWVIVTADVRQGMVHSIFCGGENSTAYTVGHAGTGITIPANVGGSHCYDGTGAMAHA